MRVALSVFRSSSGMDVRLHVPLASHPPGEGGYLLEEGSFVVHVAVYGYLGYVFQQLDVPVDELGFSPQSSRALMI